MKNKQNHSSQTKWLVFRTPTLCELLRMFSVGESQSGLILKVRRQNRMKSMGQEVQKTGSWPCWFMIVIPWARWFPCLASVFSPVWSGAADLQCYGLEVAFCILPEENWWTSLNHPWQLVIPSLFGYFIHWLGFCPRDAEFLIFKAVLNNLIR